MKKLFSLNYSLEALAALFALGATLGVLQTFIVGKHFVIPTMILLLAVVFGNLARFGARDQRWAKHILFWIFFMLTAHAFMALFWAKTPREMLGDLFTPVYGVVFVVLAFLCWTYARRNELLK
jgi:hypothetical protein